MADKPSNPESAGSGERPEAEYLAPYRRAVKTFGPGFEATLWASREKQVERFRVMAEMLDFTGRVIVDAGCGLGDFAAYLAELGVEYGRYFGLEGLGDIVEQANRCNLPEATFLEADFVHQSGIFHDVVGGNGPDVVVFSGSLNTLSQVDAQRVLDRAWYAAQESIIFNFLSAHPVNKDDARLGPARRFDPLEMLEWAMAHTPNVLFRQDYFAGHDATILMLRND